MTQKSAYDAMWATRASGTWGAGAAGGGVCTLPLLGAAAAAAEALPSIMAWLDSAIEKRAGARGALLSWWGMCDGPYSVSRWLSDRPGLAPNAHIVSRRASTAS